MTIEEATVQLELTKQAFICNYADKHISEALAMAIKSLETIQRIDDVLIRLYEWGIPFAMLLNNNGLFDSRQRAYLAKDYGAEIMFLYPRVKYTDRNGNRNSCPFQSCYWCYRVLPEKMMFEIVREDTGQMRLEGL